MQCLAFKHLFMCWTNVSCFFFLQHQPDTAQNISNFQLLSPHKSVRLLIPIALQKKSPLTDDLALHEAGLLLHSSPQLGSSGCSQRSKSTATRMTRCVVRTAAPERLPAILREKARPAPAQDRPKQDSTALLPLQLTTFQFPPPVSKEPVKTAN